MNRKNSFAGTARNMLSRTPTAEKLSRWARKLSSSSINTADVLHKTECADDADEKEYLKRYSSAVWWCASPHVYCFCSLYDEEDEFLNEVNRMRDSMSTRSALQSETDLTTSRTCDGGGGGGGGAGGGNTLSVPHFTLTTSQHTDISTTYSETTSHAVLGVLSRTVCTRRKRTGHTSGRTSGSSSRQSGGALRQQQHLLAYMSATGATMSPHNDLLGLLCVCYLCHTFAVAGSLCHLLNHLLQLRRENRHLRKQVTCTQEMRKIEQLKHELMHSSCTCRSVTTAENGDCDNGALMPTESTTDGGAVSTWSSAISGKYTSRAHKVPTPIGSYEVYEIDRNRETQQQSSASSLLTPAHRRRSISADQLSNKGSTKQPSDSELADYKIARRVRTQLTVPAPWSGSVQHMQAQPLPHTPQHLSTILLQVPKVKALSPSLLSARSPVEVRDGAAESLATPPPPALLDGVRVSVC
jgi:hypothetical protein